MKTINFTACKYLDFGDDYLAEKNLISLQGETKVCWVRRNPEGELKLCQFCSKRGRMNSPELCTSEKSKGCSDYEDFEHKVPLDTINLK